jgi:hypothetical protein
MYLTEYPIKRDLEVIVLKSHKYDTSVVHLSHCYNIHDIWIGDLWTIHTVVDLLYQYFASNLWVKKNKKITITNFISQNQGRVCLSPSLIIKGT